MWLASAYCLCALCVGPNVRHGLTASGTRPVAGWTVACPRSLPFGTVVRIDGLGARQCHDRGSAIRGERLDVFMESHSEARQFGRRWLAVRPWWDRR